MGIAGQDLRLDSRDLESAAFHSRRCSCALQRDFFKGSAVAVERCLLASQLLPALDHYIDIFGIKLHAIAGSFRQLCGRECRAASEERIIDQLATPEVVQDRAS